MATTPKTHVLLAIRNGQPEIVSTHTQWGEAQDAWGEATDARLDANTPAHELHYVVREGDHELVKAAEAAAASKPAKVKLTRTERSAIARKVRREIRSYGYEATDATVLDSAAGLVETEVDLLGRFSELPYTEISDYAHSFARQLYPAAARNF